MRKVVKLAVNRVDVGRRAAVREILQELVADKELEAVFVVTRKASGSWTWKFAGNAFSTEVVGQVEIAKHEFISDFLKACR